MLQINADTHGFNQNSSGLNNLIFHVQVSVPLLLVNSCDDPLVHPSLLEIPHSLAGCCHLILGSPGLNDRNRRTSDLATVIICVTAKAESILNVGL